MKQEGKKIDLKLNIQKTKVMVSGLITLWQIERGKWKQWQIFLYWAPISLPSVTAMKLKDVCSLGKKSYDKPKQCITKQRHHFSNKGLYSQSYGFSSSHVWMWELDHKEAWVLKNWCFQTMMLDKTLESSLDYKDIKPVYPKGN